MRQLLLFVATALTTTWGTWAAEDAGFDYAQRVCSVCGTISAEQSRNPKAPRFREVADTPGITGTALRVWMETSHPTMHALVAGLSLGLIPVQASAAEKDLTNKGEVLVKENCSRCHAIGKEGNSPHPEAPPFRTLSTRYPIEDLSESLAEGIVSGHPDMPIFVFGPADVEAIVDYLKSIQEKPEPAQPAQ